MKKYLIILIALILNQFTYGQLYKPSIPAPGAIVSDSLQLKWAYFDSLNTKTNYHYLNILQGTDAIGIGNGALGGLLTLNPVNVYDNIGIGYSALNTYGANGGSLLYGMIGIGYQSGLSSLYYTSGNNYYDIFLGYNAGNGLLYHNYYDINIGYNNGNQLLNSAHTIDIGTRGVSAYGGNYNINIGDNLTGANGSYDVYLGSNITAPSEDSTYRLQIAQFQYMVAQNKNIYLHSQINIDSLSNLNVISGNTLKYKNYFNQTNRTAGFDSVLLANTVDTVFTTAYDSSSIVNITPIQNGAGTIINIAYDRQNSKPGQYFIVRVNALTSNELFNWFLIKVY